MPMWLREEVQEVLWESSQSLEAPTLLLARKTCRKGSLAVQEWSSRSTEMDHPWTTDIEWAVLNREKVAEGKGFEPTVRVNGRRFSRPPLSHK